MSIFFRKTLSLTMFSTLLVLLGTSVSYSQQSSYWSQEGNNYQPSQDRFLGTLNQAPLVFKTSGMEVFRITPSGRIGIGTDTPEGLLDVSGSTILRGEVKLPGLGQTNANSNGDFRVLLMDENGTMKSGTVAMMADIIYEPVLCAPGAIANPTWSNGENKIYTQCPQVYVGINTSTPRVHLDVRGASYSDRIALGADPTSFISERMKIVGYSAASNTNLVSIGNSSQEFFKLTNQGHMSLDGQFEITSFASKPLVINSSTEKILQLESDGLLRVRRLKIDHDSWADYVFDKEYELMPLSEVKTYIEANHHLPEVPSTGEVQEEGLDVGEMNELLLKKVEELTLYLIQQQEEIESLKSKIEEKSE